MRKWVLICTLPALATPFCTNALTLGDITVLSELNKPFKAEIPLLSATPAELSKLKVGLASVEDFVQAGMARPSVLTELRFKVARRDDGAPYVRISSKAPVNEPILDYLVQASWSSGQEIREYTVFLDPPSLLATDQLAAEIIAPEVTVQNSSTPIPANKPDKKTAPVAATPRVSYVRGGDYGPTQPGDTLGSIVKQVRGKGQSAPQVMLALLRANPEAFQNYDINKLKVGYTLRVPEPGVILALSREDAENALISSASTGQQIAANPATSVTPPQAQEVIAELEQAAATVSDTSQEIPVQAEELDSTTNNSGASANLKLLASDENVPAPDPSTPPVDSAENASQNGFLPVSLDAAELDKVKRDLALANETLEAKRQEDAELNSRLAVLESQMASMQRLITLKNEEVVTLQARLGDLQKTSTANAPGQPGAGAEATAPGTQPAALPAAAVKIVEKETQSWLAMLGQMVRNISSNPLLQGILALLLILPLALIWLARRRRNKEQFDDFFDRELDETPLPGVESPFPLAVEDNPVQLDKLQQVDKESYRPQAVAVDMTADAAAPLLTVSPELREDSLFGYAAASSAQEHDLLTDDREILLADEYPQVLPIPQQDTSASLAVKPLASNVLEFSSPLLANPAEIGVKLDLAKAYIEMGDSEGAQNILNEVISQGNEAQRQEAKLLLLKAG